MVNVSANDPSVNATLYVPATDGTNLITSADASRTFNAPNVPAPIDGSNTTDHIGAVNVESTNSPFRYIVVPTPTFAIPVNLVSKYISTVSRLTIYGDTPYGVQVISWAINPEEENSKDSITIVNDFFIYITPILFIKDD
jgi:hypothetical protein